MTSPGALLPRLVLVGGAAALLFSTFLSWTPPGIEGSYVNRSIGAPAYAGVVSVFSSANAWQAFSVLDVLLAALAAVTLVAALVWRVAALVLVAVGATVLGGVVLYRAFESRDPFFGSLVGPGVVVGFGSLVLIAVVGTAAALRARS